MSKAEKLTASKLIVLILVLGLVLLLITLGFWQLDRAKQKEILIEQWHQPAIQIKFPLVTDAGDYYQKIEISGKLDQQHIFLLDNRTRQGKVGYELLALLAVQQDSWILVNLGWLAADSDRSILPVIQLPAGELKISGWLKKVNRAFQLQTDAWGANWPKRIQQVEMSKIAKVRGVKSIYKNILLAEKPLVKGLVTDWKPVNMSVEKHIGYAFQWFLMAIVLCALLFWLWRYSKLEKGEKAYE
ncbi:MAG: hypothetical protein MJK10_22035 [Pseudomonadales bacterium]|nr:hypothetical protein [Pseudomonadales bacterium]NRA18738.1 SURF1 family protein [Oceanospirillaceae bacterium]